MLMDLLLDYPALAILVYVASMILLVIFAIQAGKARQRWVARGLALAAVLLAALAALTYVNNFGG